METVANHYYSFRKSNHLWDRNAGTLVRIWGHIKFDKYNNDNNNNSNGPFYSQSNAVSN